MHQTGQTMHIATPSLSTGTYCDNESSGQRASILFNQLAILPVFHFHLGSSFSLNTDKHGPHSTKCQTDYNFMCGHLLTVIPILYKYLLCKKKSNIYNCL